MKKNFVQKLALGLALVMTVTSVPATSEAAAKPAFKTASVTVTEGETVKAVVKGTKGYTFKKVVSKDETVATAALKKVKAKKVKINVTGVKAGETKVVAKLAKGGKVVKAKLAVTVEAAKVESVPEIKSLEATKVNVLTATFASAVNTEDVTLAVTRGTSKVETESIVWNADKTVATITTVAKLRDGSYTVTATAASDGVSKTATVEVNDQKIASIVIEDTVALTGSITSGSSIVAGMRAYVYYDVLDQYGNSIRTSTSIQWSTSCGDPIANDKNLGMLTLKRSDDKAFTYGEQIFVTGVNSQTGVTVQATLTVGAEQALNAVEVKGFVKKNNPTNVLTELPSGFKSDAYYMLYSVTDQNGNEMRTANYYGNSDVTFISDNVLVISGFKNVVTPVTVNGVSYNAVEIVPGDFVDQGGEVNITAIANKTGNKSVKNVVVGEYAILQSFTMSAPELITDGETVEIPFVALDTNGNEITNFAVLAGNLHELTFSASDSTSLVLSEDIDGTAVLELVDNKDGVDTDADGVIDTWNWTSASTDGIDRTVALTAIVVGGSTDNLMVNISDKARPDAIYSVNAADALVKTASETINFVDNASVYQYCDFTYLDQYGRVMDNDYTDSDLYNDNGFFAATTSVSLTGTEFSGYTYGVKMTHRGNDNALSGTTFDNEDYVVFTSGNPAYTYTASLENETTELAFTGEDLKFEIVKTKTPGDVTTFTATSTAYSKPFAVVDITRVKNFAVKELNKQFVATNHSNALTGEGIADVTVSGSAIATSATPLATHNQDISVTGTFNGKTVKVPAAYYTVGAVDDKLDVQYGTNPNSGATGWYTTTAPGNGLALKDLYDVYSAKQVRKDASEALMATVYAETAQTTIYDTTVTNVTISDAAPVVTTIDIADTGAVMPINTMIGSAVGTTIDPEFWDDDTRYALRAYDQYGVRDTAATFVYTITKVVENEAGYAENNFTVSGNATATPSITGAERGDTFVLTIRANGDNGDYTTKDMNIMVIYDYNACIVDGTNWYVDTLLGFAGTLDTNGVPTNPNTLEYQRVAGLR